MSNLECKGDTFAFDLTPDNSGCDDSNQYHLEPNSECQLMAPTNWFFVVCFGVGQTGFLLLVLVLRVCFFIFLVLFKPLILISLTTQMCQVHEAAQQHCLP